MTLKLFKKLQKIEKENCVVNKPVNIFVLQSHFTWLAKVVIKRKYTQEGLPLLAAPLGLMLDHALIVAGQLVFVGVFIV